MAVEGSTKKLSLGWGVFCDDLANGVLLAPVGSSVAVKHVLKSFCGLAGIFEMLVLIEM